MYALRFLCLGSKVPGKMVPSVTLVFQMQCNTAVRVAFHIWYTSAFCLFSLSILLVNGKFHPSSLFLATLHFLSFLLHGCPLGVLSSAAWTFIASAALYIWAGFTREKSTSCNSLSFKAVSSMLQIILSLSKDSVKFQ